MTFLLKLNNKYMNDLISNIKIQLKPLLRVILNKKIKGIIISINNKHNERVFKKNTLKYYEKNGLDRLDSEKLEVINFIKNNDFNLFPYDFIKKYKPSDIKVSFDTDTKLNYSFIDNKKIYFKRDCTQKEIQNLCSALILVQDEKSPHKYLTDNFDVSKDDIVADFGAAEGDFTLSIIDRVKKAYLFESDPKMIEALQATFRPWKDKVVIVDKYISNKINDTCTTLDYFFKDKEKPTFLKVDIEGAEHDFIDGGKDFLSNNKNMKIIIASYHRHNDENILSKKLQVLGFETEFSKGYMLSTWDDIIKEPYLRRALIRAQKTND